MRSCGMQFFGGGTSQILRSSTGDLLRKLGAPAVVRTGPSPRLARSRPPVKAEDSLAVLASVKLLERGVGGENRLELL